ncbi:MAG: DUF2490 domain-containing protein [Gemmatimonadaceae bacterium]|nr:DUF2490 domain-containing protein [Gemmatimonadaceae bacterium]
MFRACLAVSLLVVPALVHAQRETFENVNAWLSWIGDIELDPRWAIDFDGSLRASGPVDQLGQVLWRASVRRNLSANVRASVGYAGSDTHPYGKLPVAFRAPEHRLFQQLQLTHPAGRVQFTHRYRFEQRWSGRVAVVGTDTSVRNWVRTSRLRYLARATIPLQGATLDANEWFVNVADEVMLNFGANIANNTFDQNRMQLGIGRRLGRDYRLELQYLDHLVLRPNGRQLERNHTIVTNVSTSFRLRRSAH